VYGLLQHGVKLVNLTGARGVGKTEVALRVVEYARERHSFSRFVFVDFGKMADYSETACLEKVASAFAATSSAGASSSNVFSCTRSGENIESTVAHIRLHLLGAEEQCLLVLDGLDCWMTATGGRRTFLRLLVTRLRQCLGPSLALLLTSCSAFELDSSREVALQGLSDASAAQLFALRAPRRLDSDELCLDDHRHQDATRAFSKSKLLQSMRVSQGKHTDRQMDR
jgi:hypothetical protein